MRTGVILLVEDAADDVLLVRRSLWRSGVEAELRSVGSGEEAVAYLRGEGAYADREAYPLPGLVLLDLGLPGMHGFEVLGWIRQQKEYEALPVVVLTSSTELKDVERAYSSGANSFLRKPLELENEKALLNAVTAYARLGTAALRQAA